METHRAKRVGVVVGRPTVQERDIGDMSAETHSGDVSMVFDVMHV